MKISLRWLSEFLSLDADVRSIGHRLTMSGLEVEGIETLGALPPELVTARIVDMKPHPNADRLTLCSVQAHPDAAAAEPCQVVCGAKNMKPGDIVPFAQAGTVLPGGHKIERSKLRGEWSNGMLCSARELGLSDEHAGLLILPPETPVGVPFSQLHSGADTVLELSITPNRADCLSVLGVARELSALFDVPLKTQAPHFSRAILGAAPGPLPEWPVDVTPTPARLTVQAPDLCPTYFGRVLTGVQIKESPKWLVDRLAAAGLRSINNVVDATNYVMLERGQPLHAFDLDTLSGAHVGVRLAQKGEKILCLDGVERTLEARDLVICDDAGVIAIAGVMGGEHSAVSSKTTRLFLEAAHFVPSSVRPTARRCGLHTDASHRFERGVDPEGVLPALDALTALILQVAGGSVQGETLQAVEPKPPLAPIALSPANVNSLLGMQIPEARMVSHLRRLGMQVGAGATAGQYLVIPPSARLDMVQEADLAEEIARVEGYEHIPTTLPAAELKTPYRSQGRLQLRELSAFLAARGLEQVINFTFVSPQSIQALNLPEGDVRSAPQRLMNPLSEEISVMRTTLLPSLLKNAAYNTRREHADLRLFEVGKVFLPVSGHKRPSERLHLGVLLTGLRAERAWFSPNPTELDLFDMKAVLESVYAQLRLPACALVADDPEPFLAPGQGWSVMGEGARLGYLGLVHPELARSLGLEKPVVVMELEVQPLWEKRRAVARFAPIPRFPCVERDLALLVPEGVTAGTLLQQIRTLGGALLERVFLFDVYRGKNIPTGFKSVACGLVIRAEDRTLVEREVVTLTDGVLEGLKSALGVSLRA